MNHPLTGSAIFVRPPTETAPHAASIAINLSLAASAPQAARPVACRVTASLMRPGTDGLAHDVADIERLATLGQAMTQRLAATAVFAAAVTTAGTRTWLLYAAGPEFDAQADVRSAARLAFAEQADYVPHVSVTTDADWAGYRDLYPTDAEAAAIRAARAEAVAVADARSTTLAVIGALAGAGVDLSEPIPLEFRLTFSTAMGRAVFAQRAAGAGFTPDPIDVNESADAFPLTVVRLAVPAVSPLTHAERWLIHEAGRTGGRYDGWTLGTHADAMVGQAMRAAA